MSKPLSIGDAIEGFHLAAVVHGLDQLGVLDAMSQRATVADLAAASGVDAVLLAVALEFVAGRTQLVEREGDGYVVTQDWSDYARACVRQYVGAYGRLALHAAAVLRNPRTGPTLVNHEQQARSYGAAPTVSRFVADLVLQLDLVPTLDLGCGSGMMLVELGRRDAGFVGWGVDNSAAMCDEARARIAASGLGDRISVLQGDALDPGSLEDLAAAGVRCITATSLLNELWGARGGGPAVAVWVRSMAAIFPGRALVVADYFGRLGHVPPPWPSSSAVHDLVQALSGQGIPPPNHDAWRDAYRDAGAELLHMVEDENRSFFIHLLRLSP